MLLTIPLLYFVLQLHLFPIFLPSSRSFISFLILSKEPPVSWGDRVAVLLQSSILLCCTDLFICFTLPEIQCHILASCIYSPLSVMLVFSLLNQASIFSFMWGKSLVMRKIWPNIRSLKDPRFFHNWYKINPDTTVGLFSIGLPILWTEPT